MSPELESCVLSAFSASSRLPEAQHTTMQSQASKCHSDFVTASENGARDNHIMLVRSKAQLKDAFAIIPEEEKTAYTEALKVAPHLVELESSAERYLRFDNFDPWAAARRIVDYWKARVELFGNRAFRPITLSGNGALNEDDVELFRTGAFMVLPPDSEGRPVIYVDKSRLSNPHLTVGAKQLRCFFYCLSAVSELEMCATRGFVLLVPFGQKIRSSTIDQELHRKSFDIFCARQIIPARMAAIHLVMMNARPIVQSMIPFTLAIFGPLFSTKVIVYQEKPLEEVQKDLKRHGFRLENLPKAPIGGLFTIGCFKRWIDDRLRRESLIFAESPDVVAQYAGLDGRAPLVAGVEEDRIRKKREAEAASARRKRARKKIHVKVLEAEVERHTQQQEELKSVGLDLERKLDEARRFVQLHEQQSSLNTLDMSSATLHGDHSVPSGALSLLTAASSSVSNDAHPLNFARAPVQQLSAHSMFHRLGQSVIDSLPSQAVIPLFSHQHTTRPPHGPSSSPLDLWVSSRNDFDPLTNASLRLSDPLWQASHFPGTNGQLRHPSLRLLNPVTQVNALQAFAPTAPDMLGPLASSVKGDVLWQVPSSDNQRQQNHFQQLYNLLSGRQSDVRYA